MDSVGTVEAGVRMVFNSSGHLSGSVSDWIVSRLPLPKQHVQWCSGVPASWPQERMPVRNGHRRRLRCHVSVDPVLFHPCSRLL